jgi:hypothetical protein
MARYLSRLLDVAQRPGKTGGTVSHPEPMVSDVALCGAKDGLVARFTITPVSKPYLSTHMALRVAYRISSFHKCRTTVGAEHIHEGFYPMVDGSFGNSEVAFRPEYLGYRPTFRNGPTFPWHHCAPIGW